MRRHIQMRENKYGLPPSVETNGDWREMSLRKQIGSVHEGPRGHGKETGFYSSFIRKSLERFSLKWCHNLIHFLLFRKDWWCRIGGRWWLEKILEQCSCWCLCRWWIHEGAVEISGWIWNMLRWQIQKDLLGDLKGDIREREYYQDFWPENLA